jgi:hypothetical protein
MKPGAPQPRFHQVHLLLYEVLAGRSFGSKFRIASGWCSPAPPTSVYDLWNSFGPSIFISQWSFSREPRIVTCHSPGRSLSTCSITAIISVRAAEFPVFCISTVTAITTIVQRATRGNSWLVLGATCRFRRFKDRANGIGAGYAWKEITSVFGPTTAKEWLLSSLVADTTWRDQIETRVERGKKGTKPLTPVEAYALVQSPGGA